MKLAVRLLGPIVLLSSLFIFTAAHAVVLISQIQIAGTTATDEFIELYNFSSSTVSLDGWSLKKMTAGGTESNLVSSFPAGTAISPFSYYLVGHHDYVPAQGVAADLSYSNASYSLAANNAALLFDSAGILTDRVDWGSMIPTAGQPATNPAASASLVRLPNDNSGNFTDSGDSSLDFVLLPSALPRNSTSPSRPEYTMPPNDFPPPPTSTDSLPVTTTAPDLWPFIKINEVFPNPTSGSEWVELFNTASTSINLAGGSLCDNRTTSDCTIANLNETIEPQSWLVITLPSSHLNNDGDSVLLKNPMDVTIDQVTYTTLTKDQAFARTIDGAGDWVITTNPTSNAANNIVAPPIPIASGSGGGSSYSPTTASTTKSTSDKKSAESKDTTTIAWHLNVPKLTLINSTTRFSALGSADPRGGNLLITWNFGSSTAVGTVAEQTFMTAGVYHVTVMGTSTAGTTGKATFTLTVKNPLSAADTAVHFIVLSPHQSDDLPEYLTLSNNSSSTVDISRWQLETESGKTFAFPLRTYIQPYSTLTFYSTATKLALPDTGNLIMLKLPDDTLVDIVAYDKSKAGATYVLGPSGWVWRLPLAAEPAVLGEKIKASGTTSKATRTAGAVAIADARALPIQTSATVTGVVTMVPGTLGKTYGYIGDDTSGIRLYSYRGDFPTLHLGDKIKVSGVLSTASKIVRLRLLTRTALTFLEPTTSTPATAVISDLGDDDLGRLVVISGEITKLSASTLYLDDGETEALVSLSTKIKFDRAKLKVGNRVAITGIIDGTSDSWRLYPRSNSDIALLPAVQPNTPEANHSEKPFNRYMAVTGSGLGLVGLALFIKKLKKAE